MPASPAKLWSSIDELVKDLCLDDHIKAGKAHQVKVLNRPTELEVRIFLCSRSPTVPALNGFPSPPQLWKEMERAFKDGRALEVTVGGRYEERRLLRHLSGAAQSAGYTWSANLHPTTGAWSGVPGKAGVYERWAAASPLPAGLAQLPLPGLPSTGPTYWTDVYLQDGEGRNLTSCFACSELYGSDDLWAAVGPDSVCNLLSERYHEVRPGDPRLWPRVPFLFLV